MPKDSPPDSGLGNVLKTTNPSDSSYLRVHRRGPIEPERLSGTRGPFCTYAHFPRRVSLNHFLTPNTKFSPPFLSQNSPLQQVISFIGYAEQLHHAPSLFLPISCQSLPFPCYSSYPLSSWKWQEIIAANTVSFTSLVRILSPGFRALGSGSRFWGTMSRY